MRVPAPDDAHDVMLLEGRPVRSRLLVGALGRLAEPEGEVAPNTGKGDGGVWRCRWGI